MSQKPNDNVIRGRVVEMGDDPDGQVRVIVETTREELMRVGNVLFERCAIVPDAREKDDEPT